MFLRAVASLRETKQNEPTAKGIVREVIVVRFLCSAERRGEGVLQSITTPALIAATTVSDYIWAQRVVNDSVWSRTTRL